MVSASEKASWPSEFMQICWMLCMAHLMSSGGQVLTAQVEKEGTSPWVYAMYFTTISGALLTSTCLICQPQEFLTLGRRAADDGTLPLMAFLCLAGGAKAIAFMIALDIVGALNAVIYIPIVPVAATIMSRLTGMEGSLTWRQIFGITMSLSGALLVTIYSSTSSTSHHSAMNKLWGNCLLLVYVTASGCQIVFTRTLVHEVRGCAEIRSAPN